MPAYNAARYIGTAIKSIQQQSYKNWRLIVCDDASTDNTYAVVAKMAAEDKRIKLIRNDKNSGIAKTSNRLLKEVRTQYAARMDADDIALPDRLKTQIEFLQANYEVVLVGGQCITINEFGSKTGLKLFPIEHKDIYNGMFSFMTVQQPTIMFDWAKLKSAGVSYDESLTIADDLDFMFQVMSVGKIANLPEFMLLYRVYRGSSSLKKVKVTFAETMVVRQRAITELGYKPNFKAKLMNFLQSLVVPLLPESLVIAIYQFKQRGFISNLQYLQPEKRILARSAEENNLVELNTSTKSKA